MEKIEAIEAWKYKDKIYEDYYEAKKAFNNDIVNHPYFLYNRKGELISSLTNTYIIYLPDIEATVHFLEDYEDEDISYTGITEEDTGLFFWNKKNGTFQYFELDLYEGIYKILAQILKK